ncbi:MAG: ClbS/DfsB family four-helix bundle protein [Dehalococcoidia bacterium]|nr:ClbS/DfsB family four-helix bundle protein [Dehalococcoidia bacterium]
MAKGGTMSDKEATLKELDTEYHKLRTTIEGLDEEQLFKVWFGTWAVKDIIAHVLGWEREMTGALQRLARGERPTPEGVDYRNADEWNAGFAQTMAGISPNTVLAAWQQVHMNYVKAARAVPEDRYAKKEDGSPSTAYRLLQASGFGHYREHAHQIREWRKREGI